MQTTNRKNHPTPLRSSAWAAALFGYELPRQASSWCQFIASAGVPTVRLGTRKLMFDEQQVRDFIARRSTGNAA